MFIYKARYCNTPEQIQEAITYYENVLASTELSKHDIHNINLVLQSLRIKERRTHAGVIPIEMVKPFHEERLECYHMAIRLIPRMLAGPVDDPVYYETLLSCFLGGLEAAGGKWKRSSYSQHVAFLNCFTVNEKILFLLHEVLLSGFHHPKQITKQINLYLKLIRLLKGDIVAPFHIPDDRKEVMVEIIDNFKY